MNFKEFLVESRDFRNAGELSRAVQGLTKVDKDTATVADNSAKDNLIKVLKDNGYVINKQGTIPKEKIVQYDRKGSPSIVIDSNYDETKITATIVRK